MITRILILSLLLTGCLTRKNLPRHNDKFPQEAAEYFADKFPVTDSIIVKEDIRFDTLYVELDPEIIRDTVIITGGDSGGDPYIINRVVEKKCPPQKIITITKTKDSIYYVRDMAREKSLELKSNSLTAENVKLKDKLNWWKIACIITWSIIGIGLAFKLAPTVKKFIPM